MYDSSESNESTKPAADCTALIRTLTALRDRALALEQLLAPTVEQVGAEQRASARNLLHYLALRQHDVRELQHALAALGLSSLGRSESHTLAVLESVLDALHGLAGRPRSAAVVAPPVDFHGGSARLDAHAQQLLGPAPALRNVRIMVTMPSEAATQPQLVLELVEAGMDLMRINCAHDDPEAWRAMVAHLRRAERERGRSCRVLADLGGPKLRTGALAVERGVQKLRPRRDVRGTVLAPARAWLVAPGVVPPHGANDVPVVPLEAALVRRAEPGDRLHVEDPRGRTRVLDVVERRDGALLVESARTVYLESGRPVRLARGRRMRAAGQLGELEPVAPALELFAGDELWLSAGAEPGHPARRAAGGSVIEPACIPCSLPEVFRDARAGQRIWFDDGKIGGRIEQASASGLRIRITDVAERGAKLRADKGINLPDTELSTPALTEKDVRDLAVVAGLADLIGLSFVRSPEDVELFEKRRAEVGADKLGTVLKIETRQGFENLPRLLMACLRTPPVGVMVARGDLAVELGFERLAEVQEEILWLCEAAHVPVIWATQVLETLTKTGAPSRAEVTDAAMSSRAECVMLNKGPYVVKATRFLSDVLERMQSHQSKKTAMLRKLSVSQLD
jgi:pyruvate kinase